MSVSVSRFYEVTMDDGRALQIQVSKITAFATAADPACTQVWADGHVFYIRGDLRTILLSAEPNA